MPSAGVHVWFWSDVTAVGAALVLIIALVVVSFVRVLRGLPFGYPQAWTVKERNRVHRQKIAASIFLILGWIGSLLSAANSPLLISGAIDWFYLDGGFQPMILLLQPMALTIFWLALVLPQDWSRRKASTAIANTFCCLIFFSLIWSRVLSGYY